MDENIKALTGKLEDRQVIDTNDIDAAQSEIAAANPEQSKGMLEQLRTTIEGYFAEVQEMSEPVRLKLEELRNSLPTAETVMNTLGTAAGNAKEVGLEMFGDSVAATKDIVGDIRQGNFSEIPRKYPVATAVLAFTGLTWLSGKILSWFDGKKRDSLFSNFFKTVATVTGVSFIARMIQKYSAKPEEPQVEASSEPSPEENAPSPSDAAPSTTVVSPAPVVPTPAPQAAAPVAPATVAPVAPAASVPAPAPAAPATPAGPAAPAAPKPGPGAPAAPKTTTAPVAPSPAPAPAPTLSSIPASISFAEFKKGVNVAGYKVIVALPNKISVNGQKWELKHPDAKVTFDEVSWSDDSLKITAGPVSSAARWISPAQTSALPKAEALSMLKKIAESRTDIAIPAAKGKEPSGALLKLIK